MEAYSLLLSCSLILLFTLRPLMIARMVLYWKRFLNSDMHLECAPPALITSISSLTWQCHNRYVIQIWWKAFKTDFGFSARIIHSISTMTLTMITTLLRNDMYLQHLFLLLNIHKQLYQQRNKESQKRKINSLTKDMETITMTSTNLPKANQQAAYTFHLDFAWCRPATCLTFIAA